MQLIENKENTGFAGGHNRLFRENDSEYFLLLNQDMYLQPNCLAELVRFLDQHPTISAVSPRIMKWDFSLFEQKQNLEESFTDVVDTLGDRGWVHGAFFRLMGRT